MDQLHHAKNPISNIAEELGEARFTSWNSSIDQPYSQIWSIIFRIANFINVSTSNIPATRFPLEKFD
jgi:hypothetical protein